MKTCAACADDVDLPFTCSYCGLYHCSKHRLPENHNCTGLNRTKTTDREYDDGTIGGRSNPKRARVSNKSWSWILWLPVIGVFYAVEVLWRYKLLGSLLVIILASAIVFGPLVASVILPEPYGERADESIVENVDAVDAAVDSALAGSNESATDTPAAVTEQDRVALSPTSQTTHTSQQTKSTSHAEVHSEPTNFELTVAQNIHELVNQERNTRDLSSLDYDSELAMIARKHSQDMALNDYFSHTQLDGDTRSDRYDQGGYSCKVSAGENTYLTGGENIFRTSYSGYSYSAQEIAGMIVDGWMNSADHRENILTDAWQNEGIGVYRTDSGGEAEIYVTQNFC